MTNSSVLYKDSASAASAQCPIKTYLFIMEDTMLMKSRQSDLLKLKTRNGKNDKYF